MSVTLRVMKRRKDGESKIKEEDFDRSKIERTLKSLGVPGDAAKGIAEDIEEMVLDAILSALKKVKENNSTFQTPENKSDSEPFPF